MTPNTMFEMLRNIRKQPKHVRSAIFYAVALIVIPVTVAVLIFSFYQTIKNVNLNPGGVQEQTFGQRVSSYGAMLFGQARQGVVNIQNVLNQEFGNMRMTDEWNAFVQSLQGKPDMQPIDTSTQVMFPIPVASSTE